MLESLTLSVLLTQAWFIAGIFVMLALPVSIYEVAMHLEYFSRPKLQIRVIRILWMVPVYALDSWLALRFEVRACNAAHAPHPSACLSHHRMLQGGRRSDTSCKLRQMRARAI